MQRSRRWKVTWALVLAGALTLTSAAAAGRPLSIAHATLQDTVELEENEPAPFAGTLYSPEAEDTLLSRIENLEAALEKAREALRERRLQADRSDSLAEMRGEEIRRLEAKLAGKTWMNRVLGVGCGVLAFFAGKGIGNNAASLTNPVPR